MNPEKIKEYLDDPAESEEMYGASRPAFARAVIIRLRHPMKRPGTIKKT